MSGPVSLYKGLVNQTGDEPSVSNWANMKFSFIITEKTVSHSNSLGQYVVGSSKTDLRITMELSISKHVNATGSGARAGIAGGRERVPVPDPGAVGEIGRHSAHAGVVERRSSMARTEPYHQNPADASFDARTSTS